MIIIAPQRQGFKNDYKIMGDTTIIFLKKRNGRIFETLIDTEDLPKLIKIDRPFTASYYPEIDNYYATCTYYFNDGTGKHKTLLLHKLIMSGAEGLDKVDHINQNETLDNRKINLRIVESAKNSSNRKGANKNSGTGHRNVNYGGKNRSEYWVQFCRKGERYKWIFPLNKFNEACDFADKKRIELFGEFAGNA